MELRRAYNVQESLVSYWAEQAEALCREIDDESLEEYRAPVEQVLYALSHDRRIMVIGAAKSGKSSILSRLIDAPLVARYAMDGHYLCWRYTCRDGDAGHSRFLPLRQLEGLELVDTADCEQNDVHSTCRTLMQGADVIIGVIDAQKPDVEGVWSLLAEATADGQGGCSVAVTHADRLSAKNAVALKESMRELCHKRIGKALPIYFLATPEQGGDTEIFRERVQETLEGTHAIRSAIRSLAERTSDLVDKQNRVLRARETVSRTDSGFLAGIEQEIDDMLTHQMTAISEYHKSFNSNILQVMPALTRDIRQRLGYVLSPVTLLRLELMGRLADRELHRNLREQISLRQEESDEQFLAYCAQHWRSVRPRMKKTLECEIGDFPADKLEKELTTLRSRLWRDAYEPLASTNLRRKFFNIFVAQTNWMRLCIIAICVLLTVAGILGCVGQDVLGLLCVVASFMVWFAGCIGHRIASKQICNSVEQLSRELCTTIGRSMRDILGRMLVSRIAAYRQLYTTPRQKVTRQVETLRPLQTRCSKIHIQLRSLIPRL